MLSPPESSFRGKDGEMYFNYISMLICQYIEDVDLLLVCGDISARVADTQGIKDNTNLYTIANRLTCDDVINGHGTTFLDLLYDNDICLLNGRFGWKSNTFTSISTRQKAVVYYVFITHEHFKLVHNFKVITMNEINDLYMKHVNDRCRIPDHNILCVTVCMSYCIDASHVHKGSDDLDLDVNSIIYPERKTDY